MPRGAYSVLKRSATMGTLLAVAAACRSVWAGCGWACRPHSGRELTFGFLRKKFAGSYAFLIAIRRG